MSLLTWGPIQTGWVCTKLVAASNPSVDEEAVLDVAHRVVGILRPKPWTEKEVAQAVPSRLGGLASTKIVSNQCGSSRA
jgi:hypothetical protein